MSLLRPRSRFHCTFNPRYRRAIRHLVTPFTPFLISDFHFGSEIHSWGVKSLNRRSRSLKLHARRVRENDRVYCQVDRLAEFVAALLPKIEHPFVLITGKNRLPPLKPGPHTDALLRSDKVKLWFSQNLSIDHPKCRPFPYGVSHFSAADVYDEMQVPTDERRREIYYGYVGIHGHLTPDVKRDRELLVPRMGDKIPVQEYLRNLHTHRFVASPQGDRPDTYRHWEAIALGCVPISNLPREPWERLFGSNMIYLDAMRTILELDAQRLDASPPDGAIATVAYWSDHVRRAAG